MESNTLVRDEQLALTPTRGKGDPVKTGTYMMDRSLATAVPPARAGRHSNGSTVDGRRRLRTYSGVAPQRSGAGAVRVTTKVRVTNLAM